MRLLVQGLPPLGGGLLGESLGLRATVFIAIAAWRLLSPNRRERHLTVPENAPNGALH